MDIEVIKSELKTKMESTIDRLHRQAGNTAAKDHTAEYLSGYKDFKSELHSTVNYLIDKHYLTFNNVEDSKYFLELLRPTIDDLITKYFVD